MRPHESLEVWETAVDFVVKIYKATETLLKEEKFGLTSQIRRAAVSIPANIAEGAGRQSDKEFLYFLSNAQGSASELSTELIISHRLGYLSEEAYGRLSQTLDSIGRMIVGLCRHLRGRANQPITHHP